MRNEGGWGGGWVLSSEKMKQSGRRRSGEVTPSVEHSTPGRRRKQENSHIDEDGDIVARTPLCLRRSSEDYFSCTFTAAP
jgi:hypothetical protein